MPIMFNTILKEEGLQPHDVRLIRHKDKCAKRGRSSYELWREQPQIFELYQSTQSFKNQSKLNTASFWAVFVVNSCDETLFAGLYSVKYRNPLEEVLGSKVEINCDDYELTLEDKLREYIGRLKIDWGKGKRAWIQYAQQNNKPIIELLREFQDPEFPGFMNFIQSLSEFDKMPTSWVATLKSSRGVYLLTCPKTKEQYVGAAIGADGFWGRWRDYIQGGHGGNLGLKSRDPSDYQVSILEVAGTSVTTEGIIAMENLWKSKLLSREMGLNCN
jgi:hypothetical protein